MTARYSFGTYSSPIALLEVVDAFLVNTLGWTRNMGPTAVSGKSGRRAHYQRTITKNGVSRTLYWNFWAAGASEVQGSFANEINAGTNKIGLYAYGSTGYDNALAWDRQPGYPVSASTGYGLFSYAVLPLAPASDTDYYLFGDSFGDAYFLLESEPDTNVCASLYAGVLDKGIAGAYDGGEFYGGSVIPQAQTVVAGSAAKACAWELPFAVGYTTGYYNTTMFVRADVDGTLGWVSIQITHGAALNPETKTALLGWGNCAVENPYNGWYVGHLPTASFHPAIPYVKPKIQQSLSHISGVTLPRDLYAAVWRGGISKPSLLGSVPIVKFCDIVSGNAIPFGTVLQGKFHSMYMAIEMIDD